MHSFKWILSHFYAKSCKLMYFQASRTRFCEERNKFMWTPGLPTGCIALKQRAVFQCIPKRLEIQLLQFVKCTFGRFSLINSEFYAWMNANATVYLLHILYTCLAFSLLYVLQRTYFWIRPKTVTMVCKHKKYA